MNDLSFEWDSSKAALNAKKHGVTFEESKTIFYDERALVLLDPDHSISEDRFIIMGQSATPRMLVVVHCFRKGALQSESSRHEKLEQTNKSHTWRI